MNYNNSNNLEDGHPSNTLFTYHVTDDKGFIHFEPKPHNIGNLKWRVYFPNPENNGPGW